MDENLTKQIAKTRKIIKAKLDAIKSNRLINLETIQQSYKPLLDVLPKKEIKQEIPIIKEEKRLSFSPIKKSISTQTFNYSEPQTLEETYIHNPEDEYIYDDSIFQRTFSEPSTIPEASFMEYLDQYPTLAREYIADRIHDTKNEFDTYYLHHDFETDKITFGDSNLDFCGSNVVLSKGREKRTYSATKGLMELLFKTKPNKDFITKTDEIAFTEIISFTNAHKRNFNPNEQILGHRGEKYIFGIKPFVERLKNIESNDEERHRTQLGLKSKRGGDLLMRYNNKPTEYVHWDNPNELVDRLKLLVASKNAGNNAHENEIISIIEELKEAHIIK